MLDRARREGWEPDYLLTTTHAEPWGKAALMRIDDKMMGSFSAQKNPPRQLGVFRQRWCPYADPKGSWVALEDMRDPGNLGTIIRTADAAGAAGIILVGQSCDPWGPDCVRATMGSIFGVPLVRLQLTDFLDLCRAWPGEIVGTHLQGHRILPPQLPATQRFWSWAARARACRMQPPRRAPRLVRIPMKERCRIAQCRHRHGLMLYEALKP